LFVFPTISENCSLVLLEAMMAGNLLVLNEQVRSLMEFGRTNALYFNFQYRDDKEENEKYYTDLAKIVGSQFDNNKVLQAKKETFQKFNYDDVFKHLIEPIFYEQD